MIKIKNIHKAFSNQNVLDGVDMLVGKEASHSNYRNFWCWKISTPKDFTRLLRPDIGEVSIGNIEVSYDKPDRIFFRNRYAFSRLSPI